MAEAVKQTKSVHEQLRDAITGVLAQKDFNLHSDRCHKLQEFGKELVTKITAEDEATKTAMSEFMTALLRILEDILQEASSARTCAVQREKAWSKFHQSRCATIGKLWEDFIGKLNIHGKPDSLLLQSVTQEVFESRMKLFFPCKAKEVPCNTLDADITDDEKNVIMYACGYVPVSLIHRYEKRKDKKYASFVQCLLHMAIGAYEDTFYDYARKWFESINRGGAFEVNDLTFEFFLIAEKKVRDALKLYMHTSDDQKAVVDKLMTDDDILFHWSMLCVDLDDDSSSEVLKDVLTLWINIRGFSITGSWIEQRKKLCGVTAKSKPGLRKGLKQTKQTKCSNA